MHTQAYTYTEKQKQTNKKNNTITNIPYAQARKNTHTYMNKQKKAS